VLRCKRSAGVLLSALPLSTDKKKPQTKKPAVMLSIIPYLIDVGKTLGRPSGVEQFSPLGLTSKMVCTLEVIIAFLISE
jgi:hypothetical protein